MLEATTAKETDCISWPLHRLPRRQDRFLFPPVHSLSGSGGHGALVCGRVGLRGGAAQRPCRDPQPGGPQARAQFTPAGSEPPQRGIYPRHFGPVLDTFAAWEAQRERAQRAGLRFGVEPKLRLPGDVLEHHTFFLIDPGQHWLEFKHYSHPEALFGCQERQTVGDLDLRDG